VCLFAFFFLFVWFFWRGSMVMEAIGRNPAMEKETGNRGGGDG